MNTTATTREEAIAKAKKINAADRAARIARRTAYLTATRP